MEIAAVLVLALEIGIASTMSVAFGWQPMPDGSSKVEYIVQLEPELVATLQSGQSIPITSDIPNDIGPIGRIRIVVGQDELPRQKLTTQFKPWPKQGSPAEPSSESIVETQYTVPSVESSGAPRYGNQAVTAETILPPGGGAATNDNPFGRTLQQSVQDAGKLAEEQAQKILPPAHQIFGSGGDNRPGVQEGIDNTADRFGNGIEQGIAQVADQTGRQLRQAADGVGQRVREAFAQPRNAATSERRPPTRGYPGSAASSATILPPNTALPPNTVASASNGNRPINSKRPADRPAARISAAPFQPPPFHPPRSKTPSFERGQAPPNFAAGSSSRQPNSSGQRRGVDATWSTNTVNPVAESGGSRTPGQYDRRAGQSPVAETRWPGDRNGRDASDYANRQRNDSQRGFAENRQLAYNLKSKAAQNGYLAHATSSDMATGGMATGDMANGDARLSQGPQFPDVGSQPSYNPLSGRSQDGPAQGGDGQFANPAAPTITRDMLDAARDENLPAARSRHAFQPPASASQSLNMQGSQFSGNRSNAAANRDPAGPQGNSTLFPLLLSWVLLSGSGAGNAYLWWSYLDVRHKYRGVVHGAAPRRGRYED